VLNQVSNLFECCDTIANVSAFFVYKKLTSQGKRV